MSSFDKEGREHDERPWGSYTVLDDKAPNYKVKLIVVLPGRRLSYQTHTRRSEHWFIVSGIATAILDGATHELAPGKSLDIGMSQAHAARTTVPRRWSSSRSKPVHTLAKTTSFASKTITDAARRRRGLTWSGAVRSVAACW